MTKAIISVYTPEISTDQYKPVSGSKDENSSHRVFSCFTVAPEDDDPKRMIEYPYGSFERKYEATPAFFVGTLDDAVHAALHPHSIEEVRLELCWWWMSFYIHSSAGHCWSIFTTKEMYSVIFSVRRFCAKRCWSTISSITTLSGRGMSLQRRIKPGIRRLPEGVELFFSLSLFRPRKWWYEIFPDLQFPDLDCEHCPMLIGMMLRASREEIDLSPFEYGCRVLQRCDRLPGANTTSTLEKVLEILCAFRKEWDLNQKFVVPYDVVRWIRLNPKIFLEISKYLSLNDSINALSMSILPLLRQEHSKVHLNNPSNRFLQLIPRHLDPKQVTSVRFTGELLPSTHDFLSFHAFDQLLSLTVLNAIRLDEIGPISRRLPTVRSVSLWFDGEFQLFLLKNLLWSFSESVTRLEIRCAGASCDHSVPEYQQGRCVGSTTITSFIFDIGHYQWNWDTSSPDDDSSCFSHSILNFIPSLINIRRVKFITSRYQIQTLLQVHPWRKLVTECDRLDQVIIQLVDDGDYTQEAANIERELRHLRPAIIFRIRMV